MSSTADAGKEGSPSPSVDAKSADPAATSAPTSASASTSSSSSASTPASASASAAPSDDCGPPVQATAVLLRSGGHVIETPVGPIQCGMPPGTIKDHMLRGSAVPQYYIVPSERFVLRPGEHQGLNVAEFEFPAYFNFFVRSRKINVICLCADVEQRLRKVIQETLFGPHVVNISDDISDDMSDADRAALPNLRRELESFRYLGDTKLEISMLVEFHVFDDGDRVVLPGDDGTGGVILELDNDEIKIISVPEGKRGDASSDDGSDSNSDTTDDEDDRVVGYLPTTCALPPLPVSSTDLAGGMADTMHFEPPLFGVTVLGCSHGFDPMGITSGYVIWVNGRGLMVDPPPNSSALLRENNIPPGIVDTVIITHCHADHDAGAFQKILQEGRVSLITTQTIYGSFLRKYAALSGLDEDLLGRVVQFRAAKIGQAMKFRGGELRFNYSLHSIPCISFEVHFGDKSMTFSADTMYAPKKLEQLWRMDVLSKGRYDALNTFPGHHDLIFHEMGGPPIHTPIEALQDLPADVKERLYVVHCAKKTVPDDLKRPEEGVENTISIDVKEPLFFEVSV